MDQSGVIQMDITVLMVNHRRHKGDFNNLLIVKDLEGNQWGHNRGIMRGNKDNMETIHLHRIRGGMARLLLGQCIHKEVLQALHLIVVVMDPDIQEDLLLQYKGAVVVESLVHPLDRQRKLQIPEVLLMGHNLVIKVVDGDTLKMDSGRNIIGEMGRPAAGKGMVLPCINHQHMGLFQCMERTILLHEALKGDRDHPRK
jgi:hypothetical protein